MKPGRHLVILGGGLTGHSAAIAARHNNFDGEITIVGDEAAPPYDRTPLSKAVLQSKRDPNDLGFQPDGDYSADRITLCTGSPATGVDFDAQIVATQDGDRLQYSELLIATGARPMTLSCPGFDLNGVFTLRTIDDAERIRAAFDGAERVVVIGAGFIGCEVAASARTLGKEVSLVDMEPAPMSGAFHPDIARVCKAIHRDHGVDLRMNARIVALRGDQQVEAAELDDGTVLECDMAIVGVGVRPNVELFTDSALEIENGVLADEFCRTSFPDVYAAGDVANWRHPELDQRIRIEHFDNAGAQGTYAGKLIAGAIDEPFSPIPYFWSDQYDANIQFAGFALDDAQVVIRGIPEERAITGFYLRDGAVCAAVTVNQAREFRAARRLVAARAKIDAETLTDPSTDIRILAREFR